MSIDMEGQDGIIADGYLSFLNEENKEFVATFEATSFESKAELLFVPQNAKLKWDSLATAFVFSMSCLILVHSLGFYPMEEFRSFPTFAIAIGVVTIVLFYFFYKKLFETFSISRYRYIYAVEQFKRYFANEQWIAFGEDVFPNQEDKHYLELKRQCFKLGVGLVIVNRNLQCRFVATPARHNLSLKKRQFVHFKEAGKQKALVETTTAVTFKQRLLKLYNPTQTVDIFRYKKIPFHQFSIVIIAFSVMLSLLIFEWNNGRMKYVSDMELYNQGLMKKAQNNSVESEDYRIDTPFEPGEFKMKQKEELQKVEKLISAQRATDIIITDKRRQALVYYDCERFANYNGEYYIIKDTILLSFDETVKRLKTLKAYDLNATAVWRGCFFGRGTGYLLYFNTIYQDSTLAKLETSELRTFFNYQTIQSSAKLIRLKMK